MKPIEALLSIMVGLIAAYRFDVNFKAIAVHLTNLIPAAREAFKEIGADGDTRRLLEAAIKQIAAGKTSRTGMPSLAYAKALLAIKTDLKRDKETRDLLSAYLVSPEVHEDQKTLFDYCMQLLEPDSATVETKTRNLNRKASILPDKTLKSQMITNQDPADQSRHIAELKHLVNKFVKRNDMHLSKDERAEVKESDPDRYDRYNDLHTKINDVWKNFIRDECRLSNGLVSVKDMIIAMKTNHINYHPLDGLIKARLGNLKLDEDAKLYTPQSVLLQQGIPPTGSEIVPNTKWDPKTEKTFYYIFKSPHAKGFTKVYTIRSRVGTKDETTDRVFEAMKTVPLIRPTWIGDLSSSDPTTRALGAMAELIWELVPRIGSPDNSVDDEDTYGLSTLTVGQVKINANTLIMSYPGKKAVLQTHILNSRLPEHKLATDIVRKLMQGKRKTDDLWTHSDGSRITASDFNNYLKEIGINITAHKFRHVRAGLIGQNLITKIRIPKNLTPVQKQKYAEGEIKKIGTSIGELLGHRTGNKKPDPDNPGKFLEPKINPNESIKSYIPVKILSDFFINHGLRVPKWLPEGGRGGDE